MKNLHTERAAVRITIDGADVLAGRDLIVMPNKELELERFLDDLSVGNRFRFIKKTEQISEHRGDKIDDGFVRIEWQYEKPKNNALLVTKRNRDAFVQPHDPEEFEKRQVDLANIRLGSSGGSSGIWHSPAGMLRGVMGVQGPTGAQGCTGLGPVGANGPAGPVSYGTAGAHNSLNAVCYSSQVSCGIAMQDNSSFVTTDCCFEDGITVKGSVSTQKFSEDVLGELESQVHSFIFRLKGVTDQQITVTAPLTTQDKLKCTTCGKTSPSSSSFCGGCGTALALKVGA